MQRQLPLLKFSNYGCLCHQIITRCKTTAHSYYDVLEVSPRAHQREVKAAYYKLSKVYHPDVNQTEEAAAKFREISEAYEILGNIRSRRLYDKGVIGAKHGSYTARQQHEEHDRQSKFYQSREKMHKTPMTGRTAIFDFDAWSKNHYGETFQRREKAKARWTRENEKVFVQRDDVVMKHLSKFLILGLIIFICCRAMEYDEVNPKQRKS